MSKLKVYYSNPYNSAGLKTSFIYKYLPINCQETKENADLVIEYVHKGFTKEFRNSPKKILISGENLYSKFNLSKAIEYFSKRTKLNLAILRKFLPRFILNMKIAYFRKDYLDYLKKIAKNSSKGEYAIISNNLSGKNVLSLPYFMQLPYIRKNLVEFDRHKKLKKIPKKFCCIIISNDSSFERIDFARKLSRYKKVDIFGKSSLTNSDNSLLPATWDKNPLFFSKYKFVICFENSFAEEYITEKLPNVMLGGSVPIYRGAPNIKDYFNTSSFINFDDYEKSYDKMIKKIIELDKDDQKYLKFLDKLWINKKNRAKMACKEKELQIFLGSILRSI